MREKLVTICENQVDTFCEYDTIIIGDIICYIIIQIWSKTLMLRIAICDNDQKDLRKLLELVDAYLSAHPGTDSGICSFYEPAELSECLNKGLNFDLFLLDILMPGIDGIEIGHLIRLREPDAPIIYTTSSQEFALNAFENHALRYLVKPVKQDELDSALDLAFSLCTEAKSAVYAVKTGEGVVTLSSDNIIYIENRGRTAVYVLDGGRSVSSVKIRSSFEDSVAPIQDDQDFMRPHKSYFVNMRHIQMMTRDTITMDNGQTVPVSRRCSQIVTQQYLKYVSQRRGGLR